MRSSNEQLIFLRLSKKVATQRYTVFCGNSSSYVHLIFVSYKHNQKQTRRLYCVIFNLQIHEEDGPQKKSALWHYFVTKLCRSSRVEFADTIEKAYDRIGEESARRLLKLEDDKAFQEFVKTVSQTRPEARPFIFTSQV